jgi:hypothetical protein
VEGTAPGAQEFDVGDQVRVLEVVPDGNPRTPRYLRGRTGTVVRCHGEVDNPLDHRGVYPPLYSVVFTVDDGPGPHDQVLADIHEEWLVRVDREGEVDPLER